MTEPSTDLELLVELDDLCERYEQEFRLGQTPRVSDYLSRVAERNRPRVLVALVSLDVSLRADDYKRVLVDQILQHYTTELQNGQSVETLRSIIQQAIDSSVANANVAKLDASKADTARLSGGDSTGAEFSVDNDATQSYEPSGANSNPSFPVIEGFRIDETLGQGGMGVVYKATQVALDRTVALKMILSRDQVSEDQLRRFEREAKAIAELKDARFVQIHQLGYHRGQPYMALEYVEGGSLEAYRKNEPQTEQFSAQLVETIASAMSQAHAIGLVHRDLKPHNILLTGDLRPKVADFGLVKRQTDDDSQQTETGLIMGTACYMSPEQSLGDSDIGPATDIHALGGILYCLLTGRPPYLGKTRHDTILQLRNEEPVPPSRLRAGVSKDLETICLKCLEKDPRKRYASASEVADECRRFLDGRPIVARPIGSLERGWRWSKRNPLGATVGMLVLTIALVTSGLSWWLTVLNARVTNELSLRKTAETKRDEADAKRAAAEETQNVVVNEAMEGYHEVVFSADSMLRRYASLLPFRKVLLSKTLMHIEGIPQTPVDIPLRYRDAAIINQRLGEIVMLSESAATALNFYDTAYLGLQRAAGLEPNDPVSYKNLGTICELQAKALRVLGKTTQAREKALEALTHAKKWAALPVADSKKDPEARKAIEEYQVFLGELALSLGDVPQANQHFSDARKIVEELGKEFDSNRALQFWFATQQGSLDIWFGEVHRKENQMELAKEAYSKAVERFQLLVKQSPKAVGQSLALATAHRTFGDFYLSNLQDYQSASNHYREASTILAGLIKENPEETQVLKDLGSTNYRWGALMQLAESRGIALKNIPENETVQSILGKSVAARRRMALADREDMQARIELAMSQARIGEVENAGKLADEMIKQGSLNPRLLFQACCTYAQCSRSADATQQKIYRDRALATLDQLKQAGWTDLVTLRSDPDLIPIQELPEFVMRLEKWNEPVQ